MFDELDFWLSQHTNEYRARILHDAFQASYDVLGTPVLELVTNLVLSYTDTPTDDALLELTTAATQNIELALNEFGVQLSKEQPIHESLTALCQLVSALTIADAYEDPNCMINICETAANAEECIADIAEEITGYNSDLLLELIESVDSSLPDRIYEANLTKSMALEALSDVDSSVDKRRNVIERVKRSEHYSREGFVESRLVVSGLFNADPFVIVQSLKPEIFDLEDAELQRACYQIACASNVATSAVLGTAKNILEDIVPEDEAQKRQRIALMLNRYPTPSVEV